MKNPLKSSASALMASAPVSAANVRMTSVPASTTTNTSLKKRSIALATSLMLALGMLFALSACADDPNTQNFVGTWEIVSLQSAERPDMDPAETVAVLEDAGMTIKLVLNKDKTAQLDSMGKILTGTWKINSPQSITITLEGSEGVEGTYANDQLTVQKAGDKMVFERE